MRIAIVHDDLMRRGGAEQVALSFCHAFPDASLYTLCFRPELTYPEFSEFDIRVSWFQKIVSSEKKMKKWFFPLGIWSMKSFDLSSYDIVLISSTYCAKYLKLKDTTKVILYCHYPFRLAWYPETYPEINAKKGLKKSIFKLTLKYLRYIDKKYARRADYFIGNSSETLSRIKDCYDIDSSSLIMIPPPVNLKNFHFSNLEKEFYLVVSRFQPYKKVDLVINVFNNMPERKLIIVGKGIEKDKLKSIVSGSNIIFKENLSQIELADLYANCKALIFPQREDFGITALEANASGRPVIAFGEGGVKETMIPYKNDDTPFTSVFFKNQTPESLAIAIEEFEKISSKVNSDFLIKNAKRFDEESFIKKIRQIVANFAY